MKKGIIFSLFLMVFLGACTLAGNSEKAKDISLEEARSLATSFINDYLMQPGQEVSISEIAEINGLYKVTVNLANGQTTDSYLSKDGLTFFPSGMEIEEFKLEAESQNASASEPEVDLADIEKNDKPKVELFVMSHCPFGTQIEKGILPVLDTLGDKIEFELKFCDYAMHDKIELDEQLLQHCIQKEEPNKLIEYLYCFLEDGDTSACLKETNINQTKVNTCVTNEDKEFKVTELYNDRNTWRNGQFPLFAVNQVDVDKYGISGSPALVINGSKIPSGRDSATLLRTICAGFENQPSECETVLAAASPSPGFGFSGTGSNIDASCE